MPEQVPPSPEVAREMVRRFFERAHAILTPQMEALQDTMSRTASSVRAFTQAYERADMEHQADVMRDDLQEMDNRLVDWLRKPE